MKRIRILRMVDMPLDQIKLVLEEKLSPADAAEAQKAKLREQQEQLAATIRFCEEWTRIPSLKDLDPDQMLQAMEAPENKDGLFHKWKEDYRKVVLAEREKVFTFIPEEPVTNPGEFTMALFAYANANGLDMVITKESMYPEFTINGIEYVAERFYTTLSRIPVASIRCSVKYPEDFEPDVEPKRKKLMKALRFGWVLIPLALLAAVLCRVGMLQSWEGWVLLLCFCVMILINVFRMWLMHYNHKQ